MYDFANKIGGDRINLVNIMPAGTEPHHWEPSPKDILEIEKADVFIYNGAGMEPWKNIELLRGGHYHDEENAEEESDGHDDLAYDPHVWLSPKNAKKQMEAIKDAFVKADPENKEYYEKNFEDNVKKLDDLDREYREELAKYTKKDIVVGHQAYGYIEGLNAESEPTPARMAEIVKFIKENDIKVKTAKPESTECYCR